VVLELFLVAKVVLALFLVAKVVLELSAGCKGCSGTSPGGKCWSGYVCGKHFLVVLECLVTPHVYCWTLLL